MANAKQIEILQAFAKGWFGTSQQHSNWLAEHLGLIDQIGYQNYLMKQM